MGMCIGLLPKTPNSPYIVEIRFRKPSEIDTQENVNGSTDGGENDCQTSFKTRERNELTMNSKKLFQSTVWKNALDEKEVNNNINDNNNNNNKLAIEPKPSSSTNAQFHGSISAWGESNDQRTQTSSAKTEEIYKRLLPYCQSKRVEAGIWILENQFHESLLTTFGRRKTVQSRLYQHKLQLKLAQESFDAQLRKLKFLFDGQCFAERWKDEWDLLEKKLLVLNKEFESFGKVQEEAHIFKHLDILIQSFEKNRLISRSVSTSKKTSHASVQCRINDSDSIVFKFNRIEQRSSQSSNACSSWFNRSRLILNRRNTRPHKSFWNLFPDSLTSSKCTIFLCFFTVIAFAVIYYLLTISSDTLWNYSCNQQCNSSSAVYGITWGELLKPFVRKQNSPHIF